MADLAPQGTVSVSNPPSSPGKTWSEWLNGHVETAKKTLGVTPSTPIVNSPPGDTMLGGGYRKRRNVTRGKKLRGGGSKKTRGRKY